MNTTATQIDTSADSQPALLMAVTSAQVCDAIKAAGCAVTAIEQDGVLRLHSASHGVGFQVLWGNSAAPDAYVDFTLSCPLRVQGAFRRKIRPAYQGARQCCQGELPRKPFRGLRLSPLAPP